MNLDLNILVALSLGAMAMCAFTLDIVSSPKQSRWMLLPPGIRWQIRITATALMVWSINLFSLAEQPGPQVGEVNWIAVTATFWLACTVVSLTGYALSAKLPAKAWDRLRWVFASMRDRPSSVPVMMDIDEVIEAHHAAGQPATAGVDPCAVPRESGRAGRMAERS